MKRTASTILFLAVLCGCGLFGPDQYSLSTTVIPKGSGTIARQPDHSTYDEGMSVTLTASPASGYEFITWSGDAASSNPTIKITMNGNKSVIANFEAIDDSGGIDNPPDPDPGDDPPDPDPGDDPEGPEPAPFLTYKVDGANRTAPAPECTYLVGAPPTCTWIGDVEMIFISTPSNTTGSYSVTSPSTGMIVHEGTNDYGSEYGSYLVTITEYGAVGERVKGTFSGTLGDVEGIKPDISVTAGEFNLIRLPDYHY